MKAHVWTYMATFQLKNTYISLGSEPLVELQILLVSPPLFSPHASLSSETLPQSRTLRSTMSFTPMLEGSIPFIVAGETFQTYFKVFGTLEGRTKVPLVVLHGGPGFSHDYLIPIGDLAERNRPVIFYDQIGSGRSSTILDKPQEFWTFDLFIDELLNLVAHFKIEDGFDLLGHSWGSMLLTETAVRRTPAGLKHCVFTNAICSMKDYGMARYAQSKQIPEWAQKELAQGFRDTPECIAAAGEFGKRFQYRVDPQPAELAKSLGYGFTNIHVVQSM
jgi:proline-specific peptidase